MSEVTTAGDQQLWTGPFADLASGFDLSQHLSAHAVAQPRITVTLLYAAGNDTMTDSVTFNLRATGSDDGTTEVSPPETPPGGGNGGGIGGGEGGSTGTGDGAVVSPPVNGGGTTVVSPPTTGGTTVVSPPTTGGTTVVSPPVISGGGNSVVSPPVQSGVGAIGTVPNGALPGTGAGAGPLLVGADLVLLLLGGALLLHERRRRIRIVTHRRGQGA